MKNCVNVIRFPPRWYMEFEIIIQVRRQTVSCEREWLACLRAILFDPVPDQGRSVLDQPLAVDRDTAIHHIHVTGEEARREP